MQTRGGRRELCGSLCESFGLREEGLSDKGLAVRVAVVIE